MGGGARWYSAGGCRWLGLWVTWEYEMTTTVEQDTRATLFRAVAANPDDETARMALRDYLDERDDPRGEFIRRAIELNARADVLLAAHEADWRRVVPCAYCEGAGQIRAQCGTFATAIACPECRGAGDIGGLGVQEMRQNDDDKGGYRAWKHTAHWRRGHVFAVECRLEEVLRRTDHGFDRRGPDCGVDWSNRNGFPCCCGWASSNHGDYCPEHNKLGVVVPELVPTEWARRVCEWHPVEEFRITDRQALQEWGYPEGALDGQDSFDWNPEDEWRGMTRADDALPQPVMDAIAELYPAAMVYPEDGIGVAEFSTRADANTALWRAVTKLVRDATPQPAPR